MNQANISLPPSDELRKLLHAVKVNVSNQYSQRMIDYIVKVLGGRTVSVQHIVGAIKQAVTVSCTGFGEYKMESAIVQEIGPWINALTKESDAFRDEALAVYLKILVEDYPTSFVKALQIIREAR
ncbi:hypothetical protein HYV31_03395 [candidate division WWE3 bacterium]|nr:hypothetical protein [candidate division WWE3 bacterium]